MLSFQHLRQPLYYDEQIFVLVALNFFLFSGYFHKLISLIAHFGNFGRMADENDTLTLVCKITEDIHNFLLRFTVKVAICFFIYKTTLNPICESPFLYALISPLCFSTMAFAIERPMP